MMRARSFFLTILFAAFAAFPARADAVVGKAVPAFVATLRDGTTFDVSAMKGKVVLVNFWASWCPDCRHEIPIIEAVWRQFKGSDFALVAVSTDTPGRRKKVDEVMRYFSFPVALVADVKKNNITEPESIPQTYLIGKDGIVRYINLDKPPLDERSLTKQIKALLEETPEAKDTDKKAETKKSKSKDSEETEDNGEKDE